MARVVLLGPQRFQPSVAEALESLGVEGTLALVTAGWQEREAEVDELAAHVARPVINLELYRRSEETLRLDRELARALRQRQERLHAMQELYRLRLDHELAAARAVLDRAGPSDIVQAERRSAIRALRTLDAGHLRRVRTEHDGFEADWKPWEREAVARQRAELAGLADDCGALLVAGGHVAVLLNRMRLFDVAGLWRGKPVVAWSAGAMVLAERVVLFHDHPPQGAGNAEVFEAGFGLLQGVLPLPHASRRLRLGDPSRVALFARRFAPALCVALDPGARIDCDGRGYAGGPGTLRLHHRGGLLPVARRERP